MAFLTQAANRGSVSTGYDVDNSLKFEADNSEYMHFTSSGQTDYERMAYSVWLKRTELGTSQVFMEFGHGTANTSNLRIGFDSSNRLFCYGNSIVWRQTNRLFRDTSAWYHLFFLFDTTTPGGLSNNRIRIWVNGEMIDHGDFGVINNPSAGAAMGFNNSLNHTIGRQTEDATAYFCGYMAQVYSSGGTPPVVGDFGEYDSNGIWVPKDISEITPPDANGFNLDFSNSSNLGNDISSRNNNMTLVNIAAADQSTDTPTNNFCTLNLQVANYVNTGGATEGGTKMPYSGVNHYGAWYGTQGFTKGKWYWEAYIPSRSSSYGLTNEMGVHTMENIILTSPYYASSFKTNYYLNFHYGYTYAWVNGTKGSKDSEDGVPALGSSSVGRWIGLALNADDGEATWYNNGSQMGNANLDIYDLYDKMQDGIFAVPYFQVYHNDLNVNFGGYSSIAISSAETDENGYGSFEYAPPTGYYAICSKNLAEYG